MLRGIMHREAVILSAAGAKNPLFLWAPLKTAFFRILAIKKAVLSYILCPQGNIQIGLFFEVPLFYYE